jgi:hypothetical protein
MSAALVKEENVMSENTGTAADLAEDMDETRAADLATADEARGAVKVKVEISVEDMKSVQAQEITTRKELGMSRRELSVEMGWTESRVWYLEQKGVRLDVERNTLDIRAMLVKLIDLKREGWTRPSVKTAKAVTPGTDVKALVATAVAEAVATARTAHAADLSTLLTAVENLLLEAKAKKSGTKGYAALVETISGMQWSAE